MADLRHLGKSEGRRRAGQLLEKLDLLGAAGKMAATYSGSMRPRLDLAMTLVGDPESSSSTNPPPASIRAADRTMWQIVRDLVAGGVTIFLTTQQLEEADQLADRIAVLDEGKLVAEGTPQELKRLVPGGHVSLQFTDAEAFRRPLVRSETWVPGPWTVSRRATARCLRCVSPAMGECSPCGPCSTSSIGPRSRRMNSRFTPDASCPPGEWVRPTNSLPSGIRWFAEYQPFTPIMETLRGLLMGTPIGDNACWRWAGALRSRFRGSCGPQALRAQPGEVSRNRRFHAPGDPHDAGIACRRQEAGAKRASMLDPDYDQEHEWSPGCQLEFAGAHLHR